MSLKPDAKKAFEKTVRAPTPADISRFFEAVEKEDASRVTAFVLTYPSLLECRDNNTRSTPFVIAARAGNLDAVKALHENGADINAADPAGMDALMNACAKGEMPVGKYLVEVAGMDAGKVNAAGMSPASCAYGQEFYAMESRMKRYALDQQEARRAAFVAELEAMGQGTTRAVSVQRPLQLKVPSA